MKNMYIIGAAVAIAIAAYFAVALNSSPVACEDQVLDYYFRSDCSHCQQVARDGSLEKLEELGVEVNKYEVIQWGMYGIDATPTFKFAGQEVRGYRTLEELKALLGC